MIDVENPLALLSFKIMLSSEPLLTLSTVVLITIELSRLTRIGRNTMNNNAMINTVNSIIPGLPERLFMLFCTAYQQDNK
jgi:hypothetical protein